MTPRKQFIAKLKARTYERSPNYHRSCYIPDGKSTNGATVIQVDVLNKFARFLDRNNGWQRVRFESLLILKDVEFNKLFGEPNGGR